jgi:uncharacterized Tic20 family protein
MDNPATNVPVQDERIMAALAHMSAVVPFWGVIAPIIIWATQKSKSGYVRFQALQALVYQLTVILAAFVGAGCYMCSFFLTFGGMAAAMAGSPSDAVNEPATVIAMLTFAIPFLVMGTMALGGGLFILYGVVGAVQALRGKSFRYIIIGARVERFLQEGRSTPGGPANS